MPEGAQHDSPLVYQRGGIEYIQSGRTILYFSAVSTVNCYGRRLLTAPQPTVIPPPTFMARGLAGRWRRFGQSRGALTKSTQQLVPCIPQSTFVSACRLSDLC